MFGVDDLISGVLGAAKPVLEHFFPDPAKRYEFEMAMRQLDLTQMQGQMEINKIEAANNSLFIAGWRPAIGWVGVFGLAYQFIIAPMAIYILAIVNPAITLPNIGGAELISLVVALLGIGAMRSYDKQKGTSPAPGAG
jgi:hypothetical protein